MKTKRDIIFVLVMALIAANLARSLITTLLGIVEGGAWTNWTAWGLVVVNAAAVFFSLWLVRMHKKARAEERKRSRVFVLATAFAIAALFFFLITTLLTIVSNALWADLWRWGFVVADAIAIVGAFWLIRAYRWGRRASK